VGTPLRIRVFTHSASSACHGSWSFIELALPRITTPARFDSSSRMLPMPNIAGR
jgi:hypothetical protein